MGVVQAFAMVSECLLCDPFKMTLCTEKQVTGKIQEDKWLSFSKV